MGKSLKGKECGKGICQRKDGLYSARFVNKQGKRTVKCFSTLQEARNWLEDAKYADKHGGLFVPSDITVTGWFEYWIKNIVGDLAPNTRGIIVNGMITISNLSSAICNCRHLSRCTARWF